MLAVLSRFWWVLALRGLAAVLFGLAALIWPGITLLTLIYLFGAFALVDGVFALAIGVNHLIHKESHVWTSLLQGLVDLVLGIIAFSFPGLTALALVFLIAAWAILTGVLEITAAIKLRDEIEGEWALGLTGVISMLFGLALIAFPRTGALAVIWLIGIFAIVSGIAMLVFAFRLRGFVRQVASLGGRQSLAI